MQDNGLVCTLTAADYRDRETAWLKLGRYVKASAAIPGAISESPEGIALSITSTGEGAERGVRETFAPLIPRSALAPGR